MSSPASDREGAGAAVDGQPRPVPASLPAAVETSARPTVTSDLRELFAYRELMWTLTLREIKVRYQQTALGAAWAIAQPLALTLAFTIFFSKLAGVSSDGLPPALFYYAALLPWTFFTTSLGFGVPSLVTNATLVTKVYFPREILPLASVLSAGVDLVAAAVVYALLLVVYRVPPSGAYIYLLPLLLTQLIFTVAVTLVLSAVNVAYRDVRYALPLVTQLWLYATPVIYPLSVVPQRIRTAYLALNPMAAVIDGYRSVLVAGRSPDLRLLATSSAAALVLLVVSYAYFKRAERSFADVI